MHARALEGSEPTHSDKAAGKVQSLFGVRKIHCAENCLTWPFPASAKESSMSTILIIVLLVVLLGGGGYGYNRWGR